MIYKLTEKEIEWVNRAIEKNINRDEIKVKLKQNTNDNSKLNAFIEYYDEETIRIKMLREKEREKNTTKEIDEDEEIFRSEYMEYLEKKKEGKMSFWEKRKYNDCIRFEISIMKYLEMLEKSVKEMKEEKKKVQKKLSKDKEKENKELEGLKTVMIETLLSGMEILEVYSPITGELANKENLKKCSVDQLLNELEDNIKILEMAVNGKIDKLI